MGCVARELRRLKSTGGRRGDPAAPQSLGSHGAKVLGLLALAAGANLELDGLTLGQCRGAGLNVGDVHEHVVATALPRDETESSVVIEELHFALHS
jgi:hypothetical protein